MSAFFNATVDFDFTPSHVYQLSGANVENGTRIITHLIIDLVSCLVLKYLVLHILLSKSGIQPLHPALAGLSLSVFFLYCFFFTFICSQAHFETHFSCLCRF